MSSISLTPLQRRYVVAILMLGLIGTAGYLGRGLYGILFDHTTAAGDLRLRHQEVVCLRDSAANAACWTPEKGGYPPWAFAFIALIVPFEDFYADRVYFLGLNLLALALLVTVIVRQHQDLSRQHQWVLVLALLSCAGVGGCIWLGQFGVVLLAACFSICHIRADKPRLSGLLMCFALVKPTIAAYFALAALKSPRIIAWSAATGVMSTGAVWLAAGVDPLTILKNMLHAGGLWFDIGASLLNTFQWLGVPRTQVALLAFAVGLALSIGVLIRYWPRLLREWQATFEAMACWLLLARLFCYHIYYDNLMIVPAVLVLLGHFFRTPSRSTLAASALALALSWIPPPLFNVKRFAYTEWTMGVYFLGLTVLLLLILKFSTVRATQPGHASVTA